jgi:predicted nuclease with TOPRIM domain
MSNERPLITAKKRLVSALERLERNLQHITVEQERDALQHQHIQYYERENSALRDEQENLSQSITQLRQQYDELQGVATTIYGKLDDSIKRLTQILEN